MKKLLITCLAIAALAVLFAPSPASAWKNLPGCWEVCGCGTPCSQRCSQGLLSATTCFQYGTCRDLCFHRPSGDSDKEPPMTEAKFIESLNEVHDASGDDHAPAMSLARSAANDSAIGLENSAAALANEPTVAVR